MDDSQSAGVERETPLRVPSAAVAIPGDKQLATVTTESTAVCPERHIAKLLFQNRLQKRDDLA